nr:UBN2 domain-containing protein [Tanacetum cinerariifolium]
MLFEGSELTKEDRESQLYDDFEQFRQHNEESINDYYVRFSKLINDMRNIKMTMPKLQLNSKFMNNMLPEWGRFVTAVKLNRELRESNYDQLFAYLKQHEAHAKEDKMVLERLSQPIAQPTSDPLALLSNGDMLLFESFLNDDPSSDSQTKSSSTSLNSLLEETNNFHNSLPECTTFSHVLCDAKCESDSSDDQSCSDEDVLEKIISKPLSEEEIIPMKSLRTHDSSLSISSKIDSLLEEFAGELTLLKSIPPGIDKADCDFEEDIRLIEKLLYDNSSPRPTKEFVFANSDAATESFSPSPILVKNVDSLMEEIDLFCTPDYPMPPGIEDEDSDSKRDILIPKDLPSNNSLSFAEKESNHFDIPSFSRPPAKPPNGDTGILNIKMMGDISEQKAFMHKLMITLASHQEKSPDLLSHRCRTVMKFNTHQFGDSYKSPPKETTKDKGLAGEVSSSTKKKRRTVAITAEDMQKRKNDVKARTTLLLALPDEHQECRSPRSQDRGKKESYKMDLKVEEPAPKVMIAIDGIGWD